jgi:hypothetical protein
VAERPVYVSKKNEKWKKFIKDVRSVTSKFPELEKYIEESEKENHENFLFVAAGEGMIVRGMHYPDGAFENDDYPIVFQTFDDGVVIAAWPRSIVKILMETLVNNFDKSKHEKGWELILNGLLEEALVKIKNGEINGI